jgi:D-alanine--poly(phosphoribitol) ligase subunit 2
VTSTSAEIERIFRDALSIEPPDPDTDIIETGLLDSMAIVTLIVELEERFSITVPPEELDLESLRTLARLTALVEDLQARGSSHVLGATR